MEHESERVEVYSVMVGKRKERDHL